MAETKTTFFNFLNEYNITIPIIQRDYAQGRQNDKAKHVRSGLLESLKRALENKKHLDLNFVYGTVKKGIDNSKPVFYPIDGQQRLTTLYLLHYYLFTVAGKTDELKKCGYFSYETRSSAVEFFSWLHDNKDELQEVVKGDSALCKSIVNMPEYQAAWNHDPTVASAITMLAAIKNTFYSEDVKKYAELLTDECPISFSVISEEISEEIDVKKFTELFRDAKCPIGFSDIMEKISGETKKDKAVDKADKTYIRMNARGKMLVDFENLRAAVDGIREKIKKISDESWNTDLIANYDQKYLDLIFKEVSGKYQDSGNPLKYITDEINEKSGTIFKNIYNILALAFEKACPYMKSETDYRYYLYECSRSDDVGGYKDAFQVYIDMVDCYFAYYVFNKEEGIRILNELSENKNYISDECVLKKEEAVVLYCYFYAKNHPGEIPNKEKIDLLLYVLQNLNVEIWKNIHSNLKAFCEVVSSSSDVIEYFSDHEINDVVTAIESSGLPDIKVRLKEQRIKARIIKGSNGEKDKKWFDTYEGKMQRKLQVILYMADYWEDYSKGDPNKLSAYLSKAEKWIMDGAEQELEFRRNYAMTTYLKEDRDELKETEDIFKCSVENKHIWNGNICFWDDNDEESFSEVEEKCRILKRTFEKEPELFNNAQEQLKKEEKYKTCWLRYAVMYDFQELLTLQLKIQNNELYINTGQLRPFYMYVLKREKDLTWGDEIINSHGIWWNYVGMWRTQTRDPFTLPTGVNTFKVNGTDATVPIEDTYNITLKYQIIGTLGTGGDKDCLISITEQNGKQYYERYKKTSDPVNVYMKETYDVTNEINRIISACETEHNNMKQFGPFDYLWLFYCYKYGKNNSDPRMDGYKKEPRASRTWKKTEGFSVQVQNTSQGEV